MFNLHCTKKLLDRIKPDVQGSVDGTTILGDWYATALFWKPQLALLVNERTLLPVIMPLAPATNLAQRFPDALAQVLLELDIELDKVKSELEKMGQVTYCKTSNRSVLGIMNQFTFQAESYRDHFGLVVPLALSVKLAGTPCSPLYKGAICPDLAVREVMIEGIFH
jgi:hypothetical protein